MFSEVSWFQHQVDRSRRVFKLVPMALEKGGGFWATAGRVLALLRASGFSGLRRSAALLEQQARGHQAPSIVQTPEGTIFNGNDYDEWVRRYDSTDAALRAELGQRLAALPRKPVISIVMPTYNANPVWLGAAIESVRSQIYPHWELCIADDASTDAAGQALLRDYAARDPRIKVVFRPKNGHISAASNSALELVIGEWVALMDHDDMLAEHALFWVADAINQDPQIRAIYSDEDKIDTEGRRSNPYFKSDWNIDLFYSQNMFSHLGVFHAGLLRQIGGFRLGFEGAQDYDVVLRCIEHIAPGQIHHIARVLYHWRVHPGSTAQSSNAKPYAELAGERALNDHFTRTHVNGSVTYIGHGYQVKYALPELQPLVSIIIPTRNGLALLRQCINSILTLTSYWNYEIIIVDNGTDDPDTLAYLTSFSGLPCLRVIRDNSPFNYSALNNMAVQQAQGELVALVNNDIEVIAPDWLTEMVSIALQPGVGAVGARLWYPDMTLQHGGVVLGVGGVAGHGHKRLPQGQYGYFSRALLTQSFSAVTAACLIVRKDHFLAVGGLNEVDLKVAFNDVDFCLRLGEAGLRNVWTPYAELFHHESATRGDDVAPEKRERFASEVNYMLARWGDVLRTDPAYNPNLTLVHEDFSLAWPPRVKLPVAAA